MTEHEETPATLRRPEPVVEQPAAEEPARKLPAVEDRTAVLAVPPPAPKQSSLPASVQEPSWKGALDALATTCCWGA